MSRKRKSHPNRKAVHATPPGRSTPNPTPLQAVERGPIKRLDRTGRSPLLTAKPAQARRKRSGTFTFGLVLWLLVMGPFSLSPLILIAATDPRPALLPASVSAMDFHVDPEGVAALDHPVNSEELSVSPPKPAERGAIYHIEPDEISDPLLILGRHIRIDPDRRTFLWVVQGFFLLLLITPFIPGMREISRPRDVKPLGINFNYVKNPYFFSESFIRIMKEKVDLTKTGLAKVNLSKEEDIWVAPPNARLKAGETVETILAASGGLTTEEGVRSSKEMYVRGNAEIGAKNELRALACEGSVRLGEETYVWRWVGAETDLTVGNRCNLGVRATSRGSIQLGEGVVFRSLFGQVISTGERTATDTKGKGLSSSVSDLATPAAARPAALPIPLFPISGASDLPIPASAGSGEIERTDQPSSGRPSGSAPRTRKKSRSRKGAPALRPEASDRTEKSGALKIHPTIHAMTITEDPKNPENPVDSEPTPTPAEIERAHVEESTTDSLEEVRQAVPIPEEEPLPPVTEESLAPRIDEPLPPAEAVKAPHLPKGSMLIPPHRRIEGNIESRKGLEIGEGCEIVGEIYCRGDVLVRRNVTIHGRVFAEGMIMSETGCNFLGGLHSLKDVRIGEVSTVGSRSAPRPLIAKFELQMGERTKVFGGVKAGTKARLQPEVRIEGNLFAEDDILISAGSFIRHNIFTQGKVIMQSGAQVGIAGETKSLIAKKGILLERGVRVHGFVSTDGEGVCR